MTPLKILVGSPTAAPYAYCLDAWISAAKSLTYPAKTIALVDNSLSDDYYKLLQQQGIRALKYPSFIKDSRERLVASRNMLRQIVLDENYDYFLSLEQDVIPPPDVIERLLSHQKPVVSGVYYKYFDVRVNLPNGEVKAVKKAVPLLAAFSPQPDKMRYLSAADVADERLLPISFCGLGCVLIRRDVLEKVSFRADVTVACHDDAWFCSDTTAARFPMFVDTGVKCKHLISGKPPNLFADIKRE